MAGKFASFKLSLEFLRALFPRWNFFDFVGYQFEVSFKVQDQKDWEVIGFQVERKPLSLFSNSTCNLALAKNNVIEHFAAEIQLLIQENPRLLNTDIEKRTSYLMLVGLIRHELTTYDQESNAFQFKVSATQAGEKIDLFYSDWIMQGLQ